MNKQLFDKILKAISNEFNEFDGLYESVKRKLTPSEKVNFEKFQSYATNIYYRKLCIGDDYASLYTSDKDGSYILSVRQLSPDWKENLYHRHVASYHSQDHEGNSTDYEVKIKNENDRFYLNLEVCSWDIGLGDYKYTKNIKSRTLSSDEIDNFLTQSNSENEK